MAGKRGGVVAPARPGGGGQVYGGREGSAGVGVGKFYMLED